MGYFNYFIKCIIRNIAYRLCKPKVLFTVLLCIIVLFGLKHYGFCSDMQLDTIIDQIATVTENQAFIAEQLGNMGVDVAEIDWNLNVIRDILANIRNDTASISSNLTIVLSKIESLNTTLVEMAEQQNIFYEDTSAELQTIRETLLGTEEELRLIREALLGSESQPVEFENLGLVDNVDGHNALLKVHIPMEYKYTYTITVRYCVGDGIPVYVGQSSINANSNENAYFDKTLIGNVPSNSCATLTFSTRDYKKDYFYFFYGFYVQDITVERSIEGIVDVIDRTNQNINNSLNENNQLQQQGNQLQQEQNQLQQEQNDLIKDDNVNTDGFEFATNDTNNPTEEGFNTLFTSIYNAFCNTSSAPLTVTLPYVNETFTIQPNLVSNAMQKCGLGFVATLIQSFYYYGVCLFIYKDINKIIEHLKSGNLTADCGNVKTEVL